MKVSVVTLGCDKNTVDTERYLADLIDPSHSAFVTQECQNGVIGEHAVFPQLADAARAQVIPNAARLAKAARASGVPVIHCIAERRRFRGPGTRMSSRTCAMPVTRGARSSP